MGSARTSGSGGDGGGVDKNSTMVPLFGPVVEGRMKLYVGGRLAAGVEGRHVYDTTGACASQCVMERHACVCDCTGAEAS